MYSYFRICVHIFYLELNLSHDVCVSISIIYSVHLPLGGYLKSSEEEDLRAMIKHHMDFNTFSCITWSWLLLPLLLAIVLFALVLVFVLKELYTISMQNNKGSVQFKKIYSVHCDSHIVENFIGSS